MSRKMLISTLHVLLAATMQIVPFANDAGLMSGTQLGKPFCFAFATINGTKPHLNNTVLYTCQGNNYEDLADWKKIIEKCEAELLNKSKIQNRQQLKPDLYGNKRGSLSLRSANREVYASEVVAPSGEQR